MQKLLRLGCVRGYNTLKQRAKIAALRQRDIPGHLLNLRLYPRQLSYEGAKESYLNLTDRNNARLETGEYQLIRLVGSLVVGVLNQRAMEILLCMSGPGL